MREVIDTSTATTMTKETLVSFKNPIVLLAMGHIVTITCLDTVLTSRILAAVATAFHIAAQSQASKQHRTRPQGADDTHTRHGFTCTAHFRISTVLGQPAALAAHACVDPSHKSVHKFVP
jgi:hypothetical protein